MGTPAIVAFESLRNALINVPPRIEAALNASNTLAQNVVIQISWKEGTRDKNAYTGYTGVSCRKTASPVGGRKNDLIPMLDIDPVFATNVGLREGVRVHLTVHHDAVVAHAIHVEPLTADDWEIMVCLFGESKLTGRNFILISLKSILFPKFVLLRQY